MRRNTERALPALSKSESLPVLVKVANPDSLPYQIYEGSKFFWRCRLKVDLNIFYHSLHDTFEVISFNVDTWTELSRVYLSTSNIMKLIEDKIKSEVATILSRTFINDDSSSEYHIARHKITNEIKYNIASQYIYDRLHVVEESTNENLKKLHFKALSGTNIILNAFVLITKVV
jgi:hypothetical protein